MKVRINPQRKQMKSASNYRCHLQYSFFHLFCNSIKTDLNNRRNVSVNILNMTLALPSHCNEGCCIFDCTWKKVKKSTNDKKHFFNPSNKQINHFACLKQSLNSFYFVARQTHFFIVHSTFHASLIF
jgi:hypothetical protein